MEFSWFPKLLRLEHAAGIQQSVFLLGFYLSDETSPISEQRKECLKYVRTVCLLRLKEWLLEINSTEQSNVVSII